MIGLSITDRSVNRKVAIVVLLMQTLPLLADAPFLLNFSLFPLWELDMKDYNIQKQHYVWGKLESNCIPRERFRKDMRRTQVYISG